MKILIVCPPFINNLGEYYHFPLGLAYISSALKNKGYSVSCLNLNHYCNIFEEVLESKLKKFEPDLFLTGGLSVHINKIAKLIKIVENQNIRIKIIVGGGIISSEPELMAKALNVDVGVIGEGEETVIDLVNHLNNKDKLDSVKGIVYKKGKKFIVNDSRNPIKNLDGLPWPDYEGFEIKKYLDNQYTGSMPYHYIFDDPREFPIISSRSCPYSCTFCFHPSGQIYRKRSLDEFFAEVNCLIEKYNINILTIYDELFSADKKRIIEFCEKIKPLNLKWVVQLRVDSVDNFLLSVMKDAGCFFISYGLESASDKILESMNKKIKVENIANALLLTKKNNIGIWGNFIFGDIAENNETIQDTIDWYKKNYEYQLNIVKMEVYPGTYIYQYACENNLIDSKLDFIKNEKWSSINLTKMSNDEYDYCFDKIKKTFQENRIIASNIKKVELEENKDFFKLDFECPHCFQKNIFQKCFLKYSWLVDDYFFFACRHCNQKFYIPKRIIYDDYFGEYIEQINQRIDFIKNIVKKKRLAIWGGGVHTFRLFEYTKLRIKDVYCIYDNNKEKLGNKIYTIPIKKFEPEIDKINGIIISSKCFENEIYSQLNNNDNIFIVKLYNEF